MRVGRKISKKSINMLHVYSVSQSTSLLFRDRQTLGEFSIEVFIEISVKYVFMNIV